MIKLQNVMVLWNDEGRPGDVRIAVVDHGEPAKNRAYNFLGKSMGACYGVWRRTKPEEQAAHIMALFTRIVGKDGVPQEEAHREFLKISEYREWVEKGTGPFSDAYWAWCGEAA